MFEYIRCPSVPSQNSGVCVRSSIDEYVRVRYYLKNDVQVRSMFDKMVFQSIHIHRKFAFESNFSHFMESRLTSVLN